MSIIGASGTHYVFTMDGTGEVTTLKNLGTGTSTDIVYSAPMNRIYMNWTPSGGQPGIYETTYDTSATSINRTNSTAANGFPISAVAGTRLDAHPTAQVLYCSAGGASPNIIYQVNLTFTSAHTSKTGFPATIMHPRVSGDAANIFGVGTSIGSAPIDSSGTIGTVSTLAMTPSSGYTTRYPSISPETGNIWVLRIKTTSGAEELMLSEYNSTGTAFIQSILIPMPDATLVTSYNAMTLGPNGKFYIGLLGRAIKVYDINSGTFTNFAGNEAESGQRDGIGNKARFTSLGAIRYCASINAILVADAARICSIPIP